ncbi:MAG: hypothetical protein OXU69_09585 [Gemmatimonadota bacterium]|nr:hypothetical protein [Acidobacteriota bacterium]MDE2984943.1 hypothetical protein [Gemmatimonadota bacterium]
MTNRSGGMGDNPVHYREETWAPLWVIALIWGACLAAVIGTVTSTMEAVEIAGRYGEALPGSMVLTLAGIGVGMLLVVSLTAMFIRLDVEVRADHIFIAFGPVNLVRKRISFSDIESVRGLTFRPLIEFGGWGIRWRPGRTAWTIRGNQAAAITLSGGKQIYVGSQHPQRLAGAIQAAMRTAGAGG